MSGIPLTLRARQPLKEGHEIEDGDYTADFVEAGTTMSMDGEGFWLSAPVPVTRAWVKDGILYTEATVEAKVM